MQKQKRWRTFFCGNCMKKKHVVVLVVTFPSVNNLPRAWNRKGVWRQCRHIVAIKNIDVHILLIFTLAFKLFLQIDDSTLKITCSQTKTRKFSEKCTIITCFRRFLSNNLLATYKSTNLITSILTSECWNVWWYMHQSSAKHDHSIKSVSTGSELRARNS